MNKLRNRRKGNKPQEAEEKSIPHGNSKFDPLRVEPELSIDCFDNKGKIWNPTIPCNADCIDPTYIGDANTHQRLRKFLVKSDVMKLREITRTKFFLYNNQELALEEKRKLQCNDKIYESIMESYDMCYRQLNLMERSAFDDMQQKYNELTELKNDTEFETKKNLLEMEHQKLYTKVFHVYQRFRYLLKLIEYFDHVSDTCDDVAKFNRIINSSDILSLFDTLPMKHGPEETGKLIEYLDKLIRPYLQQKAYMDASVWERSYQAIRRKIASYNQHLTRVVLLSHLTEIIHHNFMKHSSKKLTKKSFYKDSKFQYDRSHFLQGASEELLFDFERKERKDFINPLLEGIVPIMIRKLELGSRPMDEIVQKESRSVFEKLEKIQEKLMNLLYELDTRPYLECSRIERNVRQKVAIEKMQSKEALVLSNRFRNLLNHYKYHARFKNVESKYFLQFVRKKNKIGIISSSDVKSSAASNKIC